MIKKPLLDDLIEVCKEVYNRGLTTGAAGNVSVRIPETKYFLIKRTGSSMGRVKESDFLITDIDGNIVEGEGKPSMEINFHLGIYRQRPEIGAVIHAHPPYTVAFASSNGLLPLVTVAAKMFLKEVPNIPFAPPGSDELAKLVVEQYKREYINSVTMIEHGAITAGKDLWKAYDLMEYLEDNAKVALAMLQIKNSKFKF
ncbi:MAG: hypothetical protein PWP31_1600 [Clostridia bacterium]|nr:hypothetical protein [Clostridia bacterium]